MDDVRYHCPLKLSGNAYLHNKEPSLEEYSGKIIKEQFTSKFVDKLYTFGIILS